MAGEEGKAGGAGCRGRGCKAVGRRRRAARRSRARAGRLRGCCGQRCCVGPNVNTCRKASSDGQAICKCGRALRQRDGPCPHALCSPVSSRASDGLCGARSEPCWCSDGRGDERGAWLGVGRSLQPAWSLRVDVECLGMCLSAWGPESEDEDDGGLHAASLCLPWIPGASAARPCRRRVPPPDARPPQYGSSCKRGRGELPVADSLSEQGSGAACRSAPPRLAAPPPRRPAAPPPAPAVALSLDAPTAWAYIHIMMSFSD